MAERKRADLAVLGSYGARYCSWARRSEDRGPVEGNHRLTALTGSLLALLLALVFLTGLLMDAWWHIHYVIGFVLIPVVVLKLATTGYRAMRYYTGNRLYRAAGPPELLPRLLAPLMVVSVVTALSTGVERSVRCTPIRRCAVRSWWGFIS